MTPGWLILLARLRRMALAAVWAYKARSLFVILGVGFGVASLTLIVTAVDGAERKAVELVEWFGPDAALVFGGNFKKQAVGARNNTLTQDDIRTISQSLPGVSMVVPMRAKPEVPMRYQDRNLPGSLVIGATENYAQAWNWPLVEGRDLSEEDVRLGARVAAVVSNKMDAGGLRFAREVLVPLDAAPGTPVTAHQVP